MSKKIKSYSELKDGQRVVCLRPVVVGTVKIAYEQMIKHAFGANWTRCPKPERPRPDIRKIYYLVVAGKRGETRFLSDIYLSDGILVSDGPCRTCRGDGLLRNKDTGVHKLCTACYDWL